MSTLYKSSHTSAGRWCGCTIARFDSGRHYSETLTKFKKEGETTDRSESVIPAVSESDFRKKLQDIFTKKQIRRLSAFAADGAGRGVMLVNLAETATDYMISACVVGEYIYMDRYDAICEKIADEW